MRKLRVYVASPYTIGDQAVNVATSMDIADTLMTLGFTPFIPLLNHFQHMMHPRPYTDWLDWGTQWLLQCDCVLRLPGESEGADIETQLAEIHGIPVFVSIDDVIAWKESLTVN